MGPVAVAPMRARHVIGDRGRPMRHRAAQMRRHALAAQENLDGPGGDPRLYLVADKAKRDTVGVLGNLDMVVEIDATALPFRVLVGLLRQRQQGLTIELFEELPAAASPATEGTIIEIDQEAPDRLVEGGKREEAAVPQPRQNPATNDLYPHLDLGLVLRMMWPCRRYRRAVVTGEIRIGAVDHRFVEARPGDAGFEIIADRLSRRATEIGKCANVRGDPVRQALREGRLRVGVLA